jgi:hypothetical protein
VEATVGLKRKANAVIAPVLYTEDEQALIKEMGVNPNYTHPDPSKVIVAEVKTIPKPKAGDISPKGAGEYITMDVKGSGDRVYKVVIPQSYAKLIPKTWSWNENRFKVAGMISAGFPMTSVAEVCGVDRSTIYGWLQHPEFKEHVNGLTMETGWANKSERIAGLNKLTRMLFDKVIKELDGVKLTDKSIGAVLTSIQMIAKQLGQEKEEFIESTRVQQDVTLNGTVSVVAIPVDALLNSKTTEERRLLEEEFNTLGDNIIRNITGERD